MEIKELIDRLKNNGCDGCTYRPVCVDDDTAECSIRAEAAVTIERLSDELDKVTAELEAAIREQDERRWIPVTERLPDQGDRVLCVVKSFAFPGSKYYNILRYDKYGFNENGIYTDGVTHWMTLPEPPNEV